MYNPCTAKPPAIFTSVTRLPDKHQVSIQTEECRHRWASVSRNIPLASAFRTHHLSLVPDWISLFWYQTLSSIGTSFPFSAVRQCILKSCAKEVAQLGCSVAQKVLCSSAGCSTAHQGAAQLSVVRTSSSEGAKQLRRVQGSSKGCNRAQQGAKYITVGCSVAKQGPAQLSKLQPSSEVEYQGATQLSKAQYCLESAVQLRRVLNRMYRSHRVYTRSEECSLAQQGAAQHSRVQCSSVEYIPALIEKDSSKVQGCNSVQQGAMQLWRVQLSSVGCCVAHKDEAQLRRVQRRSAECSVAQQAHLGLQGAA